MSEITLYHGSSMVIESPQYGKGNSRNDYGLGFYCTFDIELAKEWACSTKTGGFANAYSIDMATLSILNLNDPAYGLLHWLAILVDNRVFSMDAPIALEGKAYLLEHFLPDITVYDAIQGYRADDSYFTFASDFLSNTISLSQLSRAMRIGALGEQFVLKSPMAFDALAFLRSEPADGEMYFTKRQDRDRQARDQYLRRERRSVRERDDVFMLDILREEMKHGDARLQRNLSG